ncbi:2-polyprenyl-6-methoxyphenol hydroxylase [Brachybacterium vulturis]|uniref:2-polyprenyl-6-methoxyphenol hydroxylase n=1 Tax=Brachybacterium vulturis TaxID=2017484 RepID=A0A291GQW6_9MICO|nr:FAD-dependent monooxygenase [Brachybacterium vulturis]ATG52432.1 2-polyprenyl-6-methoxyphenol hydroxylase [Brachybacterium vulturis]
MSVPLTIRILGAGVSGLAAAILLATDGHRVELIDEHFATPAVGTALALFPPAQSVLARLGVLREVRTLSAAPEVGTLRTSDGQVLATVPAGDALLTSRSELVRILLDALPGAVTTTRRRVEDIRPLREGADLLIGADGVHSLVRRSGGSGWAAARSHGVTVLRGTTPLAPPEISETWGRGWLFGITPLAGIGTNWFACVPEHRTGSRREDLAHLRRTVGGHRAVIDAVLAAATPQRTLVHGIHTVGPVWPVRQNVVLLGDAAHAMAPNLGHGANTALQDAQSLALAVRAQRGRGSAPYATAAGVRRSLRRHAARRALPDQGWRLASEATLRVAMTSSAAGWRDRMLTASLGRLGPRSG